jgi:hypothetical protein
MKYYPEYRKTRFVIVGSQVKVSNKKSLLKYLLPMRVSVWRLSAGCYVSLGSIIDGSGWEEGATREIFL